LGARYQRQTGGQRGSPYGRARLKMRPGAQLRPFPSRQAHQRALRETATHRPSAAFTSPAGSTACRRAIRPGIGALTTQEGMRREGGPPDRQHAVAGDVVAAGCARPRARRPDLRHQSSVKTEPMSAAAHTCPRRTELTAQIPGQCRPAHRCPWSAFGRQHRVLGIRQSPQNSRR